MFLTPNQRLALFLKSQQEKKAYSFSRWTEKLWEGISEETKPSLLNSTEAWILWEKIIEQESLDSPLLSYSETSKQMLEAWHLCHHWKVPLPIEKNFEKNKEAWIEDESAWLKEDHRFFLQSAKKYSEFCRENHWIDRANVLDHLPVFLDKTIQPSLYNGSVSHTYFIPPLIDCVGFDEWIPQQKEFINFCSKMGSSISYNSLLQSQGQTFQYEAPTETDELLAAIRTAQVWLKANPGARIGILVPTLEQRRFEVERLLSEHFQENEFNIAAPLSLTEYPLIRAAFLGLQLANKTISFEDFSKVLRLSLFGYSTDEIPLRAQWDVLLREKINRVGTLTDHFPLTILISLIEELQSNLLDILPNHKPHPTGFIDILKNLLSLQEQCQKKQKSKDWKIFIIQWLNILNWPNAVGLSQKNLKEQWDEILIQYEEMGRILGNHSFNEAFVYLKRLAAARTFSSNDYSDREHKEESDLNSLSAPVQVLGLLEGLGIPFDFLWVMGLNQKTWPTEPAPNPYLPYALQRSLNLPRCHPERELQVAKRLTQQLKRGGKIIVFSFAARIEDEKGVLSALLGKLDPFMVTEEKIHKRCFEEIKTNLEKNQNENQETNQKENQKKKLDRKSTSEIVPLQENELIRGGSRILNLQAACSFQAFADIRLHAKNLEPIHFGFSPALRGEIMHQILMRFWQGLKNQSMLKAFSSEQITQRIEENIHYVLKNVQSRGLFTLSATWNNFNDSLKTKNLYLDLERRRLSKLIHRFVDLELKRPPFEVIAQEVREEVQLNQLKLTLRIDRVDRLENNEELLIDYKTGSIQLSDWFGERPLDSQLPLYCIARKGNTQGAAFLIIRPDQIKYLGLASKEYSIEGIKTTEKMNQYDSEEDWETQCFVWKERLNALAREFVEGKIELNPLEAEKTCKVCKFQTICKVGAEQI